jgi:hypothetical protein
MVEQTNDDAYVELILTTYNKGRRPFWRQLGLQETLVYNMGTFFPRPYLLAVTVLMLRCILPCNADDVPNQS